MNSDCANNITVSDLSIKITIDTFVDPLRYARDMI